MPGGVFSTAKLHGMTIRESADDGSDFTNPDADYRRLFLGEDGQLHLKDSAGTVTDVAAGGNTPAAVWLTDASVQAITTSTSGGFQTVALDTETEDTDGLHSGSTGIVIPAGLNGRRMVFGANVGIAANATGNRQAKIVKNLAGTPVILAYTGHPGTSAISFRVILSTPAIIVATGDTIDVQVWQSSGGDLNTVNADGLPSLFGYTVD